MENLGIIIFLTLSTIITICSVLTAVYYAQKAQALTDALIFDGIESNTFNDIGHLKSVIYVIHLVSLSLDDINESIARLEKRGLILRDIENRVRRSPTYRDILDRQWEQANV